MLYLRPDGTVADSTGANLGGALSGQQPAQQNTPTTYRDLIQTPEFVQGDYQTRQQMFNTWRDNALLGAQGTDKQVNQARSGLTQKFNQDFPKPTNSFLKDMGAQIAEGVVQGSQAVDKGVATLARSFGATGVANALDQDVQTLNEAQKSIQQNWFSTGLQEDRRMAEKRRQDAQDQGQLSQAWAEVQNIAQNPLGTLANVAGQLPFMVSIPGAALSGVGGARLQAQQQNIANLRTQYPQASEEQLQAMASSMEGGINPGDFIGAASGLVERLPVARALNTVRGGERALSGVAGSAQRAAATGAAAPTTGMLNRASLGEFGRDLALGGSSGALEAVGANVQTQGDTNWYDNILPNMVQEAFMGAPFGAINAYGARGEFREEFAKHASQLESAQNLLQDAQAKSAQAGQPLLLPWNGETMGTPLAGNAGLMVGEGRLGPAPAGAVSPAQVDENGQIMMQYPGMVDTGGGAPAAQGSLFGPYTNVEAEPVYGPPMPEAPGATPQIQQRLDLGPDQYDLFDPNRGSFQQQLFTFEGFVNGTGNDSTTTGGGGVPPAGGGSTTANQAVSQPQANNQPAAVPTELPQGNTVQPNGQQPAANQPTQAAGSDNAAVRIDGGATPAQQQPADRPAAVQPTQRGAGQRSTVPETTERTGGTGQPQGDSASPPIAYAIGDGFLSFNPRAPEGDTSESVRIHESQIQAAVNAWADATPALKRKMQHNDAKRRYVGQQLLRDNLVDGGLDPNLADQLMATARDTRRNKTGEAREISTQFNNAALDLLHNGYITDATRNELGQIRTPENTSRLESRQRRAEPNQPATPRLGEEARQPGPVTVTRPQDQTRQVIEQATQRSRQVRQENEQLRNENEALDDEVRALEEALDASRTRRQAATSPSEADLATTSTLYPAVRGLNESANRLRSRQNRRRQEPTPEDLANPVVEPDDTAGIPDEDFATSPDDIRDMRDIDGLDDILTNDLDFFGQDMRPGQSAQNLYEAHPAHRQVYNEIRNMDVPQLADWAVQNAANDDIRGIAQQVADRLRQMSDDGVTMSVNIETPNMSEGQAGNATVNGRGVTVTLAGPHEFPGMNPGPTGMDPTVILHELLHAATLQNMLTDPDTYSGFRDLHERVLSNMRRQAEADMLPDPVRNIFNDSNFADSPAELISYGLSDPAMREFLDSIPSGQNRTLWDRFVDLLRSAIGLPSSARSALDELTRMTEEVLRDPIRGTRQPVTQAQIDAHIERGATAPMIPPMPQAVKNLYGKMDRYAERRFRHDRPVTDMAGTIDIANGKYETLRPNTGPFTVAKVRELAEAAKRKFVDEMARLKDLDPALHQANEQGVALRNALLSQASNTVINHYTKDLANAARTLRKRGVNLDPDSLSTIVGEYATARYAREANMERYERAGRDIAEMEAQNQFLVATNPLLELRTATSLRDLSSNARQALTPNMLSRLQNDFIAESQEIYNNDLPKAAKEAKSQIFENNTAITRLQQFRTDFDKFDNRVFTSNADLAETLAGSEYKPVGALTTATADSIVKAFESGDLKDQLPGLYRSLMAIRKETERLGTQYGVYSEAAQAGWDGLDSYVPTTGDPNIAAAVESADQQGVLTDDVYSGTNYAVGMNSRAIYRSREGRLTKPDNAAKAIIDQLYAVTNQIGVKNFKEQAAIRAISAVDPDLAQAMRDGTATEEQVGKFIRAKSLSPKAQYDGQGVAVARDTADLGPDSIFVQLPAKDEQGRTTFVPAKLRFADDQINKALLGQLSETPNSILRAFGRLTRFGQRMITQADMIFPIKSWFRDVPERVGLLATRDLFDAQGNKIQVQFERDGAKVYAFNAKNIAQIRTKEGRANNAIWQWATNHEFLDTPDGRLLKSMMVDPEGGATTTMANLLSGIRNETRGTLRRHFGLRRGYTKISDGLTAWSEFFEVQSALGTYKMLLDKGMAPNDARFQVLDTMNFARRGELTSTLRPLYFFLNPSIQGAYNTTRALRPDGQGNAVLGKVVSLRAAGILTRFTLMSAMAQPLLGMMAGGDEDDDTLGNFYERRPLSWRMRNIAFMAPGSEEAISVPVPYGMGAVGWGIGQIFHDLYRGKLSSSEAAAELGKLTGKELSGLPLADVDAAEHPMEFFFRTILPPALSGVVGSATGRNRYGTEINKAFLQPDELRSVQGKDSTEDFYKAIATSWQGLTGWDATPEEVKEFITGTLVGPPAKIIKGIDMADTDAVNGFVTATGLGSFYNDGATKPLEAAFYTKVNAARSLTQQLNAIMPKQSGETETDDELYNRAISSGFSTDEADQIVLTHRYQIDMRGQDQDTRHMYMREYLRRLQR